jgi:hypothetical protein
MMSLFIALGFFPMLGDDHRPSTVRDPVSATIISMRSSITTIVAVEEHALIQMQPRPDTDSQRILISDPSFLREVARLVADLRPLPAGEPQPSDFRIVVLLAYEHGGTARVGVPRLCDSMTRDGNPVSFDGDLMALIAARLPMMHQRALHDSCVAKQSMLDPMINHWITKTLDTSNDHRFGRT